MTNPVNLSFYCRYVGYSLPHWLCVIHHFSHGPVDWSFPPSSAPHFKTFQVFLIFFPQCPSFITLQKLCTKSSTLLVSYSNLNPISWWKSYFSCWIPLLPRQCWYFIARVHLASFVTILPKRIEIFNVLQLIYRSQHCGWFPQVFSHSFHYIASSHFSLSITPCYTVSSLASSTVQNYTVI